MSRKKVVNYVKNNNKSLPEYNFGNVQVVVKDPIENDIDLASVFTKINYMVPDHFIRLIDIVYIGEFELFAEKKVNAYFLDDALYISNNQDDEEDLIDDVIF